MPFHYRGQPRRVDYHSYWGWNGLGVTAEALIALPNSTIGGSVAGRRLRVQMHKDHFPRLHGMVFKRTSRTNDVGDRERQERGFNTFQVPDRLPHLGWKSSPLLSSLCSTFSFMHDLSGHPNDGNGFSWSVSMYIWTAWFYADPPRNTNTSSGSVGMMQVRGLRPQNSNLAAGVRGVLVSPA